MTEPGRHHSVGAEPARPCRRIGLAGEPRLVVRPTLYLDRLPLQPADRLPDRDLARLDDCTLDTRIVRDRIEHARRLRHLERQIEPRHPTRMRPKGITIRRQPTGTRPAAGEDRAQIVRLHPTGEPEPSSTTTEPHPLGLARTRVVRVERLGDARQLVRLLTHTQLGDRQHLQQREPPFTHRVIVCEPLVGGVSVPEVVAPIRTPGVGQFGWPWHSCRCHESPSGTAQAGRWTSQCSEYRMGTVFGPPTKIDSLVRTSPSSSSDDRRGTTAPNSDCNSMRVSGAPRQWWMPKPKAR